MGEKEVRVESVMREHALCYPRSGLDMRRHVKEPFCLSVEVVLEHGKLWRLVRPMWKVLWPRSRYGVQAP